MTGMVPLKKIWMNGKLLPFKQAKIHILTHALHYGTAIFEGIRCYATAKGPAIFRLRDHLERLYRGAKVYGFEIPYSINELEKAVVKTVKINKAKQGYVRPIIYLGYKTIGLTMKGAPVDVAIIYVKFDRYFSEDKKHNGLRCKISTWTRPISSELSPHVKASANYLNSVLAKSEAEKAGYDEAIMLTHESHVSEGTGENIFIVRKGKLITPPFFDDILGGITRESIIQIARDLGYTVEEKPILRDELYTADEVFLTGTAAEVLHVSMVDSVKIANGKVGKITARLQKKFFDIVNAKDDGYTGWLTFVK